MTSIQEHSNIGPFLRELRIEGGHTTMTASVIAGTSESNISIFERDRLKSVSVFSLARYLVAANQEERALPLMCWLAEDQREAVEAARVRLHVLGPRLRAAQRQGPRAEVRSDRGGRKAQG